MITAVCSAKGAPGVTTAALALAAQWTGENLLVEADPGGGDLALVAQAKTGGPIASSPNLIGLAAAIHGQASGQLSDYAQELACGVRVVQGVETTAQSRGLAALWSSIANTLQQPNLDVVVDLGRLDPGGATMPVVLEAQRVVVVMTAAMESVMHARALMGELAPMVLDGALMPVMVSPARHARADTSAIDDLLRAAGLPVQPCAHLPLSRGSVDRLMVGTLPAKDPLARAANAVAQELAQTARQLEAWR